MRPGIASALAAVLLTTAAAAAAAAPLVGEPLENPGMPLWLQHTSFKTSSQDLGYLEHVVAGNSSWVDATFTEGSPEASFVEALSWACAPPSAGRSAVWVQGNQTTVTMDGIAQFQRCLLFIPNFQQGSVRVDFSDEGECPTQLRSSMPWTSFIYSVDKEPVLSGAGFTAANDECAA